MKKLLMFIYVFIGMVAVGGLCYWTDQAEAMAAMPPLFDGDSAATFLVGGMIVSKASIQAIFINLKTTFNKAFEAAPSQWKETAMLVPSGSSQNDYAWFSRFPRMKKWVGDKVVKALKAFKYTVVNDDFEATVEVDRNDMDDDNIGIYAPMAQEAGYSSQQLPDEIVSDLKNDAFASLCYDGQYFYDTDHPVGKKDGSVGSVSNKLTTVLSCATKASAVASLGAARVAIGKMTDDEGRPLGLVSTILEVPPALEDTGKILCESKKLDDDSPNPYNGTLKLIVNPRLTSDTAWFVHAAGRPIKPFIYQQRKAPVFVSQTDMSADDVFTRKMYKFGAEARAAGGYALWQMSCGSTGAG